MIFNKFTSVLVLFSFMFVSTLCAETLSDTPGTYDTPGDPGTFDESEVLEPLSGEGEPEYPDGYVNDPFAQDSTKPYPSHAFYVGIGGLFSFQSFDHDDTYIMGRKPDYDNTFGGTIRFGHCFNDMIDSIVVSLEADFDYMSGYEWSQANVSSEMDIMTLMGTFKAALAYRASPYMKCGLGFMRGTADLSESGNDFDDAEETGICAQFGIGMDYFFTKNFALEVEGYYIKGFNNVDKIGYMNYAIGFNIYM